MGLFAPIALVGLPLVGLVIALYLLKLRRPSAPVASLHLWRSLTRDREANALWQRLRVSILLFLQLLALLALILALARPWVASTEPVGRNVIILVDTSASMGATDNSNGSGPTRLRHAQDKATELVDGLPEGGTATLITSDDRASVMVPASDDKARLRNAIEGLTPQASGTDMVQALTLAGAIAARQSNSSLWVLSDGDFQPTSAQVEPIPGEVHFVMLGANGSNQGISAFSIEQSSGNPSLFLQVTNSDNVTVTRRVEFTVDDAAWAAQTIAVGPGATAGIVVNDLPLSARVVQAQLAGVDSLAVDDRAWLINRASAPANVLLVTGGDRFLELALALLPTVTLYKVAPTSYDPAATINGAPVDLTVFAADVPSTTLKTLPEGNTLIFAPKTSNALIQVTGTITQPVPSLVAGQNIAGNDPSDQSGRDPLMRYVDVSQLHIASAAALQVPKWGRVVLSSDKGPLIVAGADGSRKQAVVAFDLRDTDLPVQTSYPLLMRNLITYLLPDPLGGLPAAVPPRSAVGLEAVDPRVDRILVEDPSAKEWSYPLNPANSRVAFAQTDQPGVYYVTQYAGSDIVDQEAFAVNLFSHDEAMIAPNPKPDLPAATQPSARDQPGNQGEAIFRRELWPPVALAGFLILLLEWLYAQRIAIRRAVTEWRTRRAMRHEGHV